MVGEATDPARLVGGVRGASPPFLPNPAPMQTTIVVPCYNEADRLDATAFIAFADEHPSVSFLFVNDGSSDGTAEVLEAATDGRGPRLRWMGLDRNRGKAEAVRRGMLAAIGEDGDAPRREPAATAPDLVGFWDADLATPLPDIAVFVELLERRPELSMVFGARVNLLGREVRRKLLRHYVGRVFATAAATMLRLPIYDTQCGAKLFRVDDELRSVLAEPFISRWIFDVEMIARYLVARRGTDRPALRTSIYEHPLMRWTDVKGSKLTGGDFLTVGVDLARIWRRYLVGASG